MITDEQIKEAGMELDNLLLDSLPQRGDLEFSKRFEKKMDKLIYRRKNPLVSHPVFRIAAVILLIVLLSSVVVLSVPDATASFNGLFFEEHDGDYTYVLTGCVAADDQREYDLGWLPEGYTVSNESRSDSFAGITYRNHEIGYKGYIVFTYNIRREGSDTQHGYAFHNVKHKWKEITINGRGADLFELCYITGEEAYCIIWMNEEQSILFRITCYQLSEAVKMAESVIAIENEE